MQEAIFSFFLRQEASLHMSKPNHRINLVRILSSEFDWFTPWGTALKARLIGCVKKSRLVIELGQFPVVPAAVKGGQVHKPLLLSVIVFFLIFFSFVSVRCFIGIEKKRMKNEWFKNNYHKGEYVSKREKKQESNRKS